MKIKHLFLLIVFFTILFTGCVTTSAQVSEVNVGAYLGEGYDSLQGRLFLIQARGTESDNSDNVEQEAMYKAGLITHEKGFKYFAIITNDIQDHYLGNTSIQGYVDYFGNLNIYGGNPIYIPAGDILIYVFNDADSFKKATDSQLRYYKATTFYTPLNEEQLKTIDHYNHKFGTNIGYGFLPGDGINMTAGLEYDYIFKKLSVGGIFQWTMYETPYKDYLSKDNPDWGLYDYSIYKNNLQLGVPIRYFFINPTETNMFYINLGAIPMVIFQHHDDWHTDISGFDVGVGIEPSLELGVKFHYISLDARIGYNLNNLDSYFNISAGVSCYAR